MYVGTLVKSVGRRLCEKGALKIVRTYFYSKCLYKDIQYLARLIRSTKVSNALLTTLTLKYLLKQCLL